MADPPLINPNWLTDPTDVSVAIAGYKRIRELFATKAMAPILIEPEYFPGPSVQTNAEILHLIRQSLITVYHAAATYSIEKTSEPKAVLDSKARVIEIKNLRVVDASAFPLLPPGHPMATVCKTTTSAILCSIDTNHSFRRRPCRENCRWYQQRIISSSAVQGPRLYIRLTLKLNIKQDFCVGLFIPFRSSSYFALSIVRYCTCNMYDCVISMLQRLRFLRANQPPPPNFSSLLSRFTRIIYSSLTFWKLSFGGMDIGAI